MRCVHDIKFRMLQVRENEISLRKWTGGTAQLRTLEVALTAVPLTWPFPLAWIVSRTRKRVDRDLEGTDLNCSTVMI